MATAIALTIAGSDSGGGAGIQADIKTFSALGVYGASVITAITAQNTQAVTAIEGVSPAVIEAQIAAVLDDLDVAAVKVGMLGNVQTIEAVARGLAALQCPLVLDPVMIAKSGDALLEDDAIACLRDTLLPKATLITPNLPEAARLLDQTPARDEQEQRAQGESLIARGAAAVLMKGGHAEGEMCHDLLVDSTGCEVFAAPRINTSNTHGTGCSLSSAIAAHLARGEALSCAVRDAHGWLHEAIAQADQLAIGHGHGPVHHFHALWS